MAKSRSEQEDEPKKIASYTEKLDEAQRDALRLICESRGWEAFTVAYADFAFKGPNLNVTSYTSGKVVIAGKGTQDFILDTLEPEVTKRAKLGYDEVLHPDWFESHAGLDESGKGDLFGPVITATVIAEKSAVLAWMKAGVRDSKKIADAQIIKLDEVIRNTNGVVVEVFPWGMEKYNEIMLRPRANLNRLLAWQHAQGLLKALNRKFVPWGLLDQFTKQPLVQRELARKNLTGFELRMRTKAEEDPVVAAASICARAEYVRQMISLSREFGDRLQKGAGPLAKEQARKLVRERGARSLTQFAKLHFRTCYEILAEEGKLADLPLPEPKERIDFNG